MTTFYLVGEVPVRLERRMDQSTVVEAFNRRSGRFEANSSYYSAIHRDDTGLVRELDADEFQAVVERLSHPQYA